MMYSTFLEMVGLPISDVDLVLGWIPNDPAELRGLPTVSSAGRFRSWACCSWSSSSMAATPRSRSLHSGFDARTVASYMYAGTDGIYGTLPMCSPRRMFLFLVFGAFLMRSGAADFFPAISMALVGKRMGRDGQGSPSHASTIVGLITGSAAANVRHQSGSMTIPLMKSAGFKPHVGGWQIESSRLHPVARSCPAGHGCPGVHHGWSLPTGYPRIPTPCCTRRRRR